MINIEIDDVEWESATELEARIEKAAKAVFEQLAIDASDKSVTVVLSDNETVAELNEQWRGKAAPTNVLSFPAAENMPVPKGEPEHLGDIILAAGIVHDEASAQNKSIADHTTHLVVHGLLHILGYDHVDDEQAERMEHLEIDILAELGIANPYA